MITLIEDNKEFNYKIYKSSTIITNHKQMIEKIFDRHPFLYETYLRHSLLAKDSTWLYKMYNTFCLMSLSKDFHDLFRELNEVIKLNIQDQHIWFQSWLNFHNENEVLDWHNHEAPIHGYICIDPKKSKTIFESVQTGPTGTVTGPTYEVVNELGNIYIGPGRRKHKVEVLESYPGKRITLGFDVHNYLKHDSFTDMIQIAKNLSWIPVI